MDDQSKSVAGQLLDLQGRRVVAEVAAVIQMTRPKKEIDRPEFQVALTMDGYHPELGSKSFILKLRTISGEIALTVAGIREAAETRFAASLQGIAWQNIGWFDSL